MLRLDPAFPPLWRSASTVQFGIDAIVVLDDPAPWQLRLIRELENGIPDPALGPVAEARGAPAGAAHDFLGRLDAVLVPAPLPARRALLQAPDAFPAAHSALVGAGLRAAGVEVTEVTEVTGWTEMIRRRGTDEGVSASAPEVVVVLAHHLVEPRRVAGLMSRDAAHLPVVFTGGRVEIGPLIVPGRTACLACVAAHRRDADPDWPLLAAQLVGRRPAEVGDALAWEAGSVAASLIDEDLPVSDATAARFRHRVVLRENSIHRWMEGVPPHASCLCASLEIRPTPGGAPVSRSRSGIERADDPSIRSTTTSTAFARPA